MQEEEKIHVYNRGGNIIDTKIRSSIIRTKDILPSTYIFVRNHEKNLLLVEIAQHPKSDRLYIGRLGVPAATFVRSHESHHDAALRALQEDFDIKEAPQHIDSDIINFDGTVTRLAHTFVHTTSLPIKKIKADVEDAFFLSAQEIEDLLSEDEDRFAPSFVALWDTYQDELLA